VSLEDVKDEIFDMVRPVHPLRITLHDLIACGHGDTMFSILTDLNGFWSYENREAMAAEASDAIEA
jgi:serine/threonine-protein phosphatase 2A regulatory subunit B''